MQRELLNLGSLLQADNDDADETREVESSVMESLNDNTNHNQQRRGEHHELEITSDENHPNKRAKIDKRYMSYVGRRMPRVGDDYQVVDLPRLIEDDDDEPSRQINRSLDGNHDDETKETSTVTTSEKSAKDRI
jgi:hypothetical protein